MTTNDPRCTREIKSRIAMAKAAFNRKITIFTCKLDLSLRKKLLKFYTWRIALCGAEMWTLWKGDQQYMELLKCGAGEGARRSGGPIV
jgi:predicted restriction endonuclease